ncbi:hypothetical protein HOG11_00990 [bacterium]|nr:hypothetical protein [bacterium]
MSTISQVSDGAGRVFGETVASAVKDAATDGGRKLFTALSDKMLSDLGITKGPHDNSAHAIIDTYYKKHTANKPENYKSYLRLCKTLPKGHLDNMSIILIGEVILTSTFGATTANSKNDAKVNKKNDTKDNKPKKKFVESARQNISGIDWQDKENFTKVCETIDSIIAEFNELEADKNLSKKELVKQLIDKLDTRRLLGDSGLRYFWEKVKDKEFRIPQNVKIYFVKILDDASTGANSVLNPMKKTLKDFFGKMYREYNGITGRKAIPFDEKDEKPKSTFAALIENLLSIPTFLTLGVWLFLGIQIKKGKSFCQGSKLTDKIKDYTVILGFLLLLTVMMILSGLSILYFDSKILAEVLVSLIIITQFLILLKVTHFLNLLKIFLIITMVTLKSVIYSVDSWINYWINKLTVLILVALLVLVSLVAYYYSNVSLGEGHILTTIAYLLSMILIGPPILWGGIKIIYNALKSLYESFEKKDFEGLGKMLILAIVLICLAKLALINPAITGFILILLSILLVLSLWGFYGLSFTALKSAIFMVELGKNVTLEPAIWLGKSSGTLLWKGTTWPLNISINTIKSMFAGILTVLGVDADKIEMIIDGKSDLKFPDIGDPFDKVKEQIATVTNKSKFSGEAIKVTFQATIYTLLFSTVIFPLVGHYAQPGTYFAELKHPYFFWAFFLSFILIAVDRAMKDYEIKSGKKIVKLKGFVYLVQTTVSILFIFFVFKGYPTVSSFFDKPQILSIHNFYKYDVTVNRSVDNTTYTINNRIKEVITDTTKVIVLEKVKQDDDYLVVRPLDEHNNRTNIVYAIQDPAFFESKFNQWIGSIGEVINDIIDPSDSSDDENEESEIIHEISSVSIKEVKTIVEFPIREEILNLEKKDDYYVIDLPLRTGNGNSSIILKPSSSAQIQAKGKGNIGPGSGCDGANRFTNPNGYVADWNKNRTSIGSWPLKNGQVSINQKKLGGVYARFPYDSRWTYIGSNGVITNHYDQDMLIYLAVNDDFYDERGHLRLDWINDNPDMAYEITIKVFSTPI